MAVNFSITLLMQAFNQSDNSPEFQYEHKVVLYTLNENISKSDLKKLVLKCNGEEDYTVEGSNKIYWKPVKIIDLYEIDDFIVFENCCVVYRRHFVEENLQMEEIIEKYFSDYVWEDLEDIN